MIRFSRTILVLALSLVAAIALGADDGSRRGTVLETINSGSYTYLRIETAAETFWVAAPVFKVAVGDEVVVAPGMAMDGFHSKTLDRTFDRIDFVDWARVAGSEEAATTSTQTPQLPPGHAPIAQMPPGHPPTEGDAKAAPAGKIDVTGIEKAKGGLTVAELYAQRPQMVGKATTVRGRVVKFSKAILGTNWIHLQDGSGGTRTGDLVVRTADTATVGDLVLVTGNVAVDVDLGFGYRYDVLLEKAKVDVEKKAGH